LRLRPRHGLRAELDHLSLWQQRSDLIRIRASVSGSQPHSSRQDAVDATLLVEQFLSLGKVDPDGDVVAIAMLGLQS
jgi:hypothetical protein